jgi:gluconokinase
LRTGVAQLRFVHLSLPLDVAQARVASRGGHFYPPALVASQFATLEDPAGEGGVLTVDATQPPDAIAGTAARWLQAFNNA